MILEGFEIENWSCIRKLAIADLPATGVVVLHGPDGTGKSSIIEALRACLMDNKSTSKALGRGFQKNSADKPRVSVTFRASGTTWRINKFFGTNKSTLEKRTASGQWKLETSDASEAHDRTRDLAGGSDSNLGLCQLLWLTQAEFHLPEPRKFDADVQSRLRTVFGVLQTPLDDRFITRIKEEWASWFSSRGRKGDKGKLREACSLAKNLAELQKRSEELANIEEEFNAYEKLAERSSDLEVIARNLRRQQQESSELRGQLQKEYEQGLKRLEAHQRATDRLTAAEKALADANDTKTRRQGAEERLRIAIKGAETAAHEKEEATARLDRAVGQLRESRTELQRLQRLGRELDEHRNAANRRKQGIELREKLTASESDLARAEVLEREIAELEQAVRDHPAPDDKTLKRLEGNRAAASSIREELKAAAIVLSILPNGGAAPAQLDIDGASPARRDGDGSHAIRRQAVIVIPEWGRIDIKRGANSRGVDEMEVDLSKLENAFSEELAPFGISASDATALDRLRTAAAESKARAPILAAKQQEIKKLASRGLVSLREEIARINKLLQADNAAEVPSEKTSANVPDLERLAARLTEEIQQNETNISAIEQQIVDAEILIEGPPVSAGKTPASPTLRAKEATATELLASLNATAKVVQDEIDRMLTSEQIEGEINKANAALTQAKADLEAAKLTESEETISERLDAASQHLRAIDGQLEETQKELHQNEGALRQAEGLHQKRAAAAARVDELTRATERDRLQSDAVDQLCQLFEESREKQLGTVMGPIHDRVMRWMRLLRVASYESIHFNDQFLPAKLVGRGAAAELALDEESIGTIEQLGLMVRLALGSALATAEEPVIAILDDPLTHSDVVRLERMGAVLRNAATGDLTAAPPIGPLQILVFTCHPEWFAHDSARVIDLSKPEMLSRYSF